MRAWLVRAGRYGERETLALEENLTLIGWDNLPDLSSIQTRDSLMDALHNAYPDDGEKRLMNWQAQLWAFLRSIAGGVLVPPPQRGSPAVAMGKVDSKNEYRHDLPSDARHTRKVHWLTTDLP